MIPLLATFPRLSVSPRRGTACRARSWVGSSLGFVVDAFRGAFFALRMVLRSGRFCLPSSATISLPCAPGFSFSRHHSPELEGGLPFAPFAKGGLFRSNATAPPLSPLGFLFHESRFTSHESLTLEAHP